MRYAVVALFVLLTAGIVLTCGEAQSAPMQDVSLDTSKSDTTAASRMHVLLDYPLTPTAGAVSMQSAAQVVYHLEDEYLPIRWGSEDRFVTKTAGILYRAGRLVLLDIPVASLHDIVQHEYFGHGGRGRLAGGDAIAYRIPLPFPYGPGGGSASFRFDDGTFSLDERASLSAGGIEVTTLGMELLEDRWMRSGRMDYRETLLYFGSLMLNVGYIRDANVPQRWVSHDVEKYVFLTTLGDHRIDDQDALERLQLKALVELANFQFFLSITQLLKEYLVEGKPEIESFRIPVAGAFVSPQVHLWLAPYGAEFGVRLLAASRGRLLAARFRWRSDATSIGLRADDLVRPGRWSMGARIEGWRQPHLIFDFAGWRSPEKDLGLLASTTVRGNVGLPFALVGEVGAKTRGFVPGERLSAGPVVRVGIDLGSLF